MAKKKPIIPDLLEQMNCEHMVMDLKDNNYYCNSFMNCMYQIHTQKDKRDIILCGKGKGIV